MTDFDRYPLQHPLVRRAMENEIKRLYGEAMHAAMTQDKDPDVREVALWTDISRLRELLS